MTATIRREIRTRSRGRELELTVGLVPPAGWSDEDLLVLYLADRAALQRWAEALDAHGITAVRAVNPDWNRMGHTVLDPDGYRVVIAVRSRGVDAPLQIGWYEGEPTALRGLFELAEDSVEQPASYLELGQVLVARCAATTVGNLQLVSTDADGEAEPNDMAVLPQLQATGVGRALGEEAMRRSEQAGYLRTVVATATADTGDSRLDQRVGFRMHSIDPDAFTPETGYPEPIAIERHRAARSRLVRPRTDTDRGLAMHVQTVALAGQDTLLACWRALARSEFGPGQLVATPHAIAAVFPDYAFFNNAILTAGIDSVDTAAASLADVYGAAGIATWALWVPSEATAFDGPTDRVGAAGSLVRDVTTLAMRLTLPAALRQDDRVRTTSGTALRRLVADEAVHVDELAEHDPGTPVTGWALVEQGQAVASAYTHRHGADLGSYAVGTLPAWRRRGLARVLVEHILAVAYQDGARTASLQSTPMGRSVYAALGFRTVGRYEEWFHAPAPELTPISSQRPVEC